MAKKKPTDKKDKEKAKENDKKKPEVNDELNGFDITINNFGEINSTYDLDKLNDFLNKNVDDKKLRNRKETPGKEDKPEKE
jgi:hypothetical protein